MGDRPVSSSSFGDLLRKHRLAAGLSQEELAERANLSSGGVSALERGTRRGAYRDTVDRLTKALGLSPDECREFGEAATHGRGRRSTDEPGSTLTRADLPTPLTSFIGRSDEVAAVAMLLDGHRLVTITGSGGVGKTRTAIEVATTFARLRNEEVRFVDLSSVHDDGFVLDAIARALGSDMAQEPDRLRALAARSSGRRLLLVLDGCEHLLAPVTNIVSTVLKAGLGIRILCTSRERLGITGEAVYRLPPLSVPPLAKQTMDRRTSYEAVQLFIERAAATEPRFSFSEDRVEIAADICRRLEGIPLAIELSVARLPTIGLTVLQSRLHDHFTLANADRSAPRRHRTMLATIGWSFDLLTDLERSLLCRCAIFAGRFTLHAVEAVCSDTDVPCAIIPETLSHLVDKSLVTVIVDQEPLRYTILDSIRDYAITGHTTAQSASVFSRRHAEWMAEFAESAGHRSPNVPRRTWLSEVEPELDNLRAALRWTLSPACEDTTLAARIVGALRRLWISTGRHVECRDWAERALDRIDRVEHPTIVAPLLRALLQCTHDDSMFALAEQAIVLFEQIDDRLGLASLYSHLTFRFGEAGRFAEAERSAARALALFQERSDTNSYFYAGLLYNRGTLRQFQGRPHEARGDFSSAEAIYKALGDELSTNAARMGLAEVAFELGDARRAATIVEELRVHANREDMARAAMHLPTAEADYRLRLGDLDAAKTLACEALEIARGHTSGVVSLAIMQLAAVAALSGKAEKAARLLGYIDAWYLREGLQPVGPPLVSYGTLLASLRDQLPAEALEIWSAAGALLNEHEAAEEALAI